MKGRQNKAKQRNIKKLPFLLLVLETFRLKWN
jgi:hypothetical protein